MEKHKSLANTDIVILCGGLGKRLRSEVDDAPKVLAKINGEPFLGILLKFLQRQGFRRVILAAGYKAEMIKDFCAGFEEGLSITVIEEEKPLGTGGAVKNTARAIKSDPFFALNGDCFCALDFGQLLDFYKEKKAMACLAVCELQKKEDFGTIEIGKQGEILAFKEKESDSPSPYASAGIYCFNKSIFSLMPTKDVFSIETEFFPGMVGKNFFAFQTNRDFIDIGTPERYRNAKDFLKKIKALSYGKT